MSGERRKEYLHRSVEQVNPNLALKCDDDQLLADIEESEAQVKRGDVVDHQEVIRRSKEWIKPIRHLKGIERV